MQKIFLNIVFIILTSFLYISDDTNKCNWLVKITKIKKNDFFATKKKISEVKNNLKKITDFKTAKKMLAKKVKFGDKYEHTDELVTQIFNPKSKKFESVDEEAWFVAYYPELDILLCEGGHTTDISYNLITNEKTEDTGNPDYFVYSKDKTMLLNSHFNGQECYSFFIQKKINNRYEKIIQLDPEFDQIKKFSLCTVDKAFWLNNNTLFVEETDNYEGKNPVSYYYKIELISK